MAEIPPSDEQNTIVYALKEVTKELRKQRRWKNVFRLLICLYLIVVIAPSLTGFDQEVGVSKHKPHTALVDLTGVIMDDSNANADNVVAGLREAFDDDNARGIILRINSPGGSPVQADYIFAEIKRLQKKHKDIKLYAVCVDVCASAAYYIASAADEIYANPSSLVGSIGVLLDGFGFVDTLQKFGVERRLLTAGKNKGFLDPFSPLTTEGKTHAQLMLNNIHKLFIKRVEEGRGKRLHLEEPDLFTGLIWTGEQARGLGLIDGYGSSGSVARDVIKSENIIDYTFKPGYFEQIASHFGSAMFKNMWDPRNDILTQARLR